MVCLHMYLRTYIALNGHSHCMQQPGSPLNVLLRQKHQMAILEVSTVPVIVLVQSAKRTFGPQTCQNATAGK